jgi:hypothetical protein
MRAFIKEFKVYQVQEGQQAPRFILVAGDGLTYDLGEWIGQIAYSTIVKEREHYEARNPTTQSD